MCLFPPEQRISCEPRTQIGAMKMKSFVDEPTFTKFKQNRGGCCC